MKASLIGIGQAGGKVTRAIREMDQQMGFGTILGSIAINTADSDLAELNFDTLLIGQERVKGHGVGADNELGALIMEENLEEVMGALDGVISPKTEAIFLVAGLGGGTGSGGVPVLAKQLQRIYQQPVYAIGILPASNEGGIYQENAGKSLKTIMREVDNVLLMDNGTWQSTGESVSDAYGSINEAIARRLAVLMAAGENVDEVAQSVVDSSEIINTLAEGNVSAVGYATAEAGEDPEENISLITSVARNAVLSNMSVPKTTTAESALVVVAGKPDRLSRKGVERARNWIQEETGTIQVRGGDLPLNSDKIIVIVVLSGVSTSARLSQLMEDAKAAEQEGEEQDPADAFDNEEIDRLF